MRVGGIAQTTSLTRPLVAFCLLCASVASAQYQPPSETLDINTSGAAFTWVEEPATNVVLLDGPVTIKSDTATFSADQAVLWIFESPGRVLDQQRTQIALIGNAKIVQGQVVREGERLFAAVNVRGRVRITSGRRVAQNQADTDLFKEANLLRTPGVAGVAPAPVQRRWLATPGPAFAATQPAANIRPTQPVSFRADEVQTITGTDGKLCVVLSGNVVLLQTRTNRDFIELQADSAVLFTPLKNLRELGEDRAFKRIEDAVTSAYLEGDVRIGFTPARAKQPEQRLRAQRVYYEFATDRAVLTDAVIHSLEPTRQIPVVVRADAIKQLGIGEYRTEKVELSTSSFAVPSYSVAADRAYIRSFDTKDPRYGQRTEFRANNATFQLFDVPVFWLPAVSGSVTERGTPLRSIGFASSNRFGPSFLSNWGLFETLGILPPEGLDIGYSLDYLGDRGPAFGFDGSYRGGFVTETTRQPWNFTGDFDSYFIWDSGEDRFGGDRAVVQPDQEFRGQAIWEHQHFFPEDWQLQLRAGWASDPTFLEEYYENVFNDGLPHDVSAYLKRQRNSEALTFLLQFQPNGFVTNADWLQENFEIERLPEIGYYRIGESFGQDRFTFSSANTVAGLKFQESDATLAELGFRPGQSPGLPAVGTTGITDDTVYRGDFRQQIDYPFSAGQFRFVPYVMGRYIPYSDSPSGDAVNRFLGGAGMRVSTAFWKVDDTAHSKLLDINRIRHVIEPEAHVYTSFQTDDQNDVFIFDEDVDKINDITAVQLALRQRWQTKRGGPGRWRSVDFFTFNVECNFFANQPDEVDLTPKGFRGLFFYSMPEASVPRNSINADALWRVSDTFAVLADQAYNLDEMSLATASIGVAVQADPRVSYFGGVRYIGEINSTIASFAFNYELSTKYSVQFTESVNLSDNSNQDTTFTVIRRFDTFAATFSVYYDAVDDESGVRFAIVPQGLGTSIGSDRFGAVFGAQ